MLTITVRVYAGVALAVAQPLSGIRAEPSDGTTGFTNGINSAILRYSGAEDEDPSTIQNTEGTVLDEADLHVRTRDRCSFFGVPVLTRLQPLVDPGAVGLHIL